jgi:hypothetical protein
MNTITQTAETASCYVSMNREPGVTASPEIVHECGGNDWTCPIGVRLDLDEEYAADVDAQWEDDVIEAVKALYAGYRGSWSATLNALIVLGWAPKNAADAVRRSIW